MTATVLHTPPAVQLRLASVFHVMRAVWAEHQRRAAVRRDLARAGRLGPRLLADMGIAPDAGSALVGDWDSLQPNGYLVRRSR